MNALTAAIDDLAATQTFGVIERHRPHQPWRDMLLHFEDDPSRAMRSL
jgi:hypothetical protein